MYDAAGVHTATSHLVDPHLIDPHHTDAVQAAATAHVADTSHASAPAHAPAPTHATDTNHASAPQTTSSTSPVAAPASTSTTAAISPPTPSVPLSASSPIGQAQMNGADGLTINLTGVNLVSGNNGTPEVGGGVRIGAPGTFEITSATVSIGAGFVSGDTLTLFNSASTISQGKVTATLINNASGAEVIFTGTDSAGVYQDLLVDIDYNNTLKTVTAADDMRTFEYSITDNNIPASTASVNFTSTVTAGGASPPPPPPQGPPPPGPPPPPPKIP
jgi:hypothetical protein